MSGKTGILLTCGKLILCVIFWSLSTEDLIAESTNKRMLLPGAKAQALGGAFTAVADDASAGWYNPAGLGLIDGPGISVTANNYSRSKKTVAGITTDSSLQENSSALYPGFAGGHTKLGPFAVGWSYFTSEQQNTDESSTIDVTTASEPFAYTRTELTTGNLIHAGASLALPIGKSLSLGVSEFYYRRQKRTALYERSLFTTGYFYDSFLRQSTLNEGTSTVVGILMRVSSFSAGMSARIPRALSDKTTLDTSSVVYTGSNPEISSTSAQAHREDELIVRTWNLGLAWKPAGWISLSGDLVHYLPSETSWPNAGGFDTERTTDWSVGSELTLGPVLLAGGAFKNSSLVKEPTPKLTNSDPSQINFEGYSTAIGFKTKQSETLLIMTRQAGKGKTQAIQGALELQDVTVETESYSISSRYQF